MHSFDIPHRLEFGNSVYHIMSPFRSGRYQEHRRSEIRQIVVLCYGLDPEVLYSANHLAKVPIVFLLEYEYEYIYHGLVFFTQFCPQEMNVRHIMSA